MKVAFLDRDGTIIKDYPDEVWRTVKEPEFIEGSIKAIKNLIEKGFEIIIITNQYLIDEGYISLEQYRKITNKMLSALKENEIDILDVFFCPHSRIANCQCIKPKTGMIDNAVEKYPKINLKESILVGDSLVDVDLGNKIGVTTFGIGLNTNEFIYTYIDNLGAIVKYI